MATFSPATHSRNQLYRMLIGAIVPRPIGWVSTRSREGVPNLAPFSFFNGIGSMPPHVAFSPGDRADRMKDTTRNLTEHPFFIVHIVSEDLADAMNLTCGDFGAHVDEINEAGLTAVPGTAVDVPRVAEAPVALECKVSHHLRLGREEPLASHIIGEILHFHVEDRLLNAKGYIQPEKLRAVGRMGGLGYTRTQDRFDLVRPVIAQEDPKGLGAPAQAQAAVPVPPKR